MEPFSLLSINQTPQIRSLTTRTQLQPLIPLADSKCHLRRPVNAGKPTFIAEGASWSGGTPTTMDTSNSATAFHDSDQEKNWLISNPRIFNPIIKQTGGTCYAVAAQSLCETEYALQYGKKIKLSKDIPEHIPKRQVRHVLQHVAKHGISQIPTGLKLSISEFKHYPRMNEEDVLKELNNHPICGVVRSSSHLKKLKPGQIYKGSSKGTLHALLLIGYGSKDGVKFYHVRNSWGTTWCSNGYGMVRRDIVKRFSFLKGKVFLSE